MTTTAITVADPVTPAAWELVTEDDFAIAKLLTIVASLTNPRKTFDPVKLKALADDIAEKGMLQPILVRALPGSRMADTDRHVVYEIVAGERRFRAAKLAGLESVPVLVRILTDDQVREIQLTENLQRDDLTELEEAEGLEQLMQHAGLTADQVGAKIKRSRAYVYARLKLLDLCTEARTALRTGAIDASRALLLARIPDTTLQIKALESLSAKDYSGDTQMGYRAAQALIQRVYMLHLDRAPFEITDASLMPEAGSCKTCSKRTGHNPDLFADVQGADVCTDPPCYHRKEEAHTALMLANAQANGQIIIEGREAKALMPNSWGGVDGYLRLDEVQDSPTAQPLRKLLVKQLEAEGIKPTLIANPHKAGELIAVLPNTQVADLLKATQHTDAAERVAGNLERSKKADAELEKAKAKTEYEQGWRTLLLERTWAAIKNDGEELGLTDKVLRYLAMHFANAANTDRAKRLCQILDLGKVAPKAALIDYITDAERPQDVLQLLIMQADVEYLSYMSYMAEHYPDRPQNVGLMLVAADYGVDADAIKAEVKAKMRCQAAPATTKDVMYRCPMTLKTWSGRGLQPKWVKVHLEKGGTLEELLQVPLPLNPAAQAQGVGKAKKPKTTAAQAQALIAAALQEAQGSTPGADAQGNQADSSQPVATSTPPVASAPVVAGVALAVDARVVVTSDLDKLPVHHHKWAGKEGVIQQKLGAGAWMVSFRGRKGGLASLDKSELTVVV